MLRKRWLEIAILWVYLPRYSITCFGPKKGRLAYTTQFLDITALAMVCGIVICFRKQAEKSSEPYRYDLEFFNIERKLYGITNDVPSDIFVWKLLRKD
jgi:hypothetical protein